MQKERAEAILLQYEDKISGFGFKLRNFLLKELKGIIEIPDEKANIIGYGFGPVYSDLICTIIPSKKGIKLGFYKGSQLADPENLLTGSGKVHKFVEMKSFEDINAKSMKELLKEGLKAYKERKK